MNRLDLAGLIASRLCHDMAGSIGAIANGAELLRDETDPIIRAEFVEIIGQSASVLVARLRLYRLTFGAALNAPLSAAEARDGLVALFADDGRIIIDWQLGIAPLDRTIGKLLLTLALIGSERIERSGTVTLADEPQGPTITIVGMLRPLSAAQRAALLGMEINDTGSQAAMAYYAEALAAAAGVSIRIKEEMGSLQFVVWTSPGA